MVTTQSVSAIIRALMRVACVMLLLCVVAAAVKWRSTPLLPFMKRAAIDSATEPNREKPSVSQQAAPIQTDLVPQSSPMTEGHVQFAGVVKASQPRNSNADDQSTVINLPLDDDQELTLEGGQSTTPKTSTSSGSVIDLPGLDGDTLVARQKPPQPSLQADSNAGSTANEILSAKSILQNDARQKNSSESQIIEFPPLTDQDDTNQLLAKKASDGFQRTIQDGNHSGTYPKNKLSVDTASSRRSPLSINKDPIVLPLPKITSINPKTLEAKNAPPKKSFHPFSDSVSPDPATVVENPSTTVKPPLTNRRIPVRKPLPHPVVSTEPVDWWKFQAGKPQRESEQVRAVGLGELVKSSLQNSPRIKFLKQTPKIVQQDVDDADSLFDPLLKIDSLYSDSVDPVGNTLTTGGAPFLEENTWSGTMAIRQKLRNGFESRVYQTLGFQNSNSTFFTPQDQGTATFGIDFTMPLLRDAGVEANQAPVVIAQLEAGVAWHDYQVELQKELYEIASLYWTLYNSRIQVLLREKSLKRAEAIYKKLEARANYDTSPTQISQAKAEVSTRQRELQDAYLNVRDQEISLRERIGKAEFRKIYNLEIIPSDVPGDWFPIPNKGVNSWIDLALAQRSELKRDRARTKVSEQQIVLGKSGLAPKLDLIFGISASALEEDSGLGQAFTKQFGSTTPGFRVGVDYELPFGRRAGNARLAKARYQHQQRLESVEVQRNAIVSEVAKAYNFMEVSNKNYHAAYKAASDIRKSVVQLQQRWEEFAFIEGAVSQGATPSLALDRLLAGQRRLTEAETILANAELNRVIGRLRIALATGSLLHSVNDNKNASYSFQIDKQGDLAPSFPIEPEIRQ